jgi:uncharacterized membrane protein YuzA (DUF378 family)
MDLSQFKPAAPKSWLIIFSGVMWSAVGLLLISLAAGWFQQVSNGSRWVYWAAGLAAAAVIFRWGFSKLARKNILRIKTITTPAPCFFAFQEWHSYLLIGFMMGLGITLRKFTPIPKPVLGVLYTGIGGGLFRASITYYHYIVFDKSVK